MTRTVLADHPALREARDECQVIRVELERRDRLQRAMDSLLGVREARGVRPFRGIREAFKEIAGSDILLVREAIVTGDFPQVLKNSLTKRLIQDYAEVGMGGLEQVIFETEVDDFKTQDRVRAGYYGDLPTVAENAPYTELTKPTDEIINYAVAKRGGFLDITWETILNDDTGKIQRFPERVARAARRTLKQYITDFFINNPNYDPDGTAWFVAGHSNLGSAALSSAELDARSIALAKQTEKDSAKRLGLPLDWIMVPVDLAPTAHQINTNTSGTNNWAGIFGPGDERIIVNELLTDVTDWYGGSLSARAPFLEIGYLRGFRAPQIQMVGLEQRRAITAIDKVQFFAVHIFGGDIVDFRPAFKNVVAG